METEHSEAHKKFQEANWRFWQHMTLLGGLPRAESKTKPSRALRKARSRAANQRAKASRKKNRH